MALVINSTTGEIDLSASTAGTYTVTYTVGLDTATTQVIINNPPNAVVTGDSTYCQGESGVTLSANSGNYSYLWSTGETTQTIDVTAGTYNCVVTELANGNCSDQSQDKQVTVTPRDNSNFTYSAASYSQSGTDPTPTITGLTGGTFTATRGLVINSSTGEIDLSASTVAEHTVTYTTNGPCPSSSTFAVGITAGFANTYSVNFDGVNDYAQASNTTSISGTYNNSVMAWVKFTGYEAIQAIIYQWENPNYTYLIRYNSGSSKFQWYIRGNNNVTYSAQWTQSITYNQWYHICGVKDGTTLRLYVDGIERATGTVNYQTKVNTSSAAKDTISKYSNTYYTQAHIDEIALFPNTILTASQISTIYNSGNGAIDLSTYNPTVWWRMGDNNGGTGTTISNEGTGSSNNMILYNGANITNSTP